MPMPHPFNLEDIKQRLEEAQYMVDAVLGDPEQPGCYRNDIPESTIEHSRQLYTLIRDALLQLQLFKHNVSREGVKLTTEL
jgi:hypothetical protein